MGGDNPMFEEEKLSNDTLDILNIVHRTFQENTLYSCLALGFFIYFVLVYLFMMR